MNKVDYNYCPHCGGYIVGLKPQKREWEVAMNVGCGRPWCNVENGIKKTDQQKLIV